MADHGGGEARSTTLIVGGTGLLGYHSAQSLLAAGHRVTNLSTGSIPLDGWYPPEVQHQQADVFTMTVDQLRDVFRGHRSIIYAVGPDDRNTPARPAAEFFQRHLVETTERVLEAAADVGVERLVVFGSYFTYLHRTDPERKLDQHHPYVAARVAQLDRCSKAGDGGLSVSVFEIPYVFGTMPQRMPIWDEVLVNRLKYMWPWILFPPGGTVATSARYVGEAARAATEVPITGPVPIGEENLQWTKLLGWATEELHDKPRRVVTIPPLATVPYGAVQRLTDRVRGLEAGLDYVHYLRHVQPRPSFFPEPLMDEVAAELGIERQSVEHAVRRTFARCRSTT